MSLLKIRMTHIVLTVFIFITSTISVFSEYEQEIYPGKLIRFETISKKSNPFIKVKLNGIIDSKIAFEFRQWDHQFFEEKPIYEKMLVLKNSKDVNNPGIRRFVHGEFIEGPIVERTESVDLGPLVFEDFKYLGSIATTDRNGILRDARQILFSRFDYLKQRSIALQFASVKHGNYDLELTRSDLYELLEMDYDKPKRSHPQNLTYEATWYGASFSPGTTAGLSIVVRNSGSSGEVSLVLARSMSRWSWLDGKMFYFGTLLPGQEKHFVRLFQIPEDIEEGTYYLRVGLRDYSGTKLQLPLVMNVKPEKS
jgi:hypothetical protein